MKIKTWHPEMTDKDTSDLAYWERNVLALHYADGWYNDDVCAPCEPRETFYGTEHDVWKERYKGWRRVLSLEGGAITFHIPDDFDVGNLKEIERNWDGHTTEEKWQRILKWKGIDS